MSELESDPETAKDEGPYTPVRLRREHTCPSGVALQFPDEGDESSGPSTASVQRRLRPRSASYVALRSAVYQITSLSDFSREKIGSGFFADVYKVKHKTTGEVMVLKMNKCRTNSRKMLSEIQLMNRLSHPNILKFRGSCVHEGQLHALTEYINGGSLGTWLHNTNIELSWSQRVQITRDIARGMAYLHSKGVFHRDLNSSNCLIQKHPAGRLRTVVADFGLAAKIKQRRRRSHTEIVGSPYWMAPECLHGQSYCEQADVFSFGVTLAEIMARVPADPEYMPRTKQFGMDCEALKEMCPDCPEELFDLTKRCCQLDPDDRPTFEEIVKVLDSVHLDDNTSEDEDEDSQKHSQEQLQNTRDTNFHHHRQQTPVAQSPTGDPMDLRGCISEPFLRLKDSSEDLSSTSELGLHSRLDSTSSLATSTEASSSGSSGSGHRIIEEEECEFSLINEAAMSGHGPNFDHPEDENSTGVVPAFAREGMREIGRSESRKITFSEDTKQPVSNDIPVESSGCAAQNSSVEESCVASDANLKMLGRRSSEGDLKFNHLSSSNQDQDKTTTSRQKALDRKFRYPLIKSISLNTANEQESSSFLSSGNSRHLLSANILNSSMQTLVGDEPDDLKMDNLGGGGDSGIDPGEAEVFKFPPKIELSNGLSDRAKHNGVVIESLVEDGQSRCAQNGTTNGGVGVANSVEGDLTPLCASPTFVSTAAKPIASQTPHSLGDERNSLVNGTVITQSLLEMEEGEPLLISTPHHLGSLGGSGNVHDPFVTPYRRLSSPNAQSCASSEYSFYLPSPSFPWAPPSSPISLQKQSRSLPATPTHATPTNIARNHFRYSQEITSSHLCSAVYPVNYISEGGDLRDDCPSKVNHALYSNGDFGESIHDSSHVSGKTVHFLPVDIDRDPCKRLDDDFSSDLLSGDLSYKLSHKRSRSHSNPAHMITKESASTHYSLTYARSPPATPTKDHEPEHTDCYAVRTRTSHHTLQQLKCFNIRLRRGVRLSNSAPNLPSMLSLHSPAL